MNYKKPYIIREKLGNNAFAWEERRMKYGHTPELTVPSLIEGNMEDVKIGNEIVFEEMEDGVLRSCRGLKNFVRLRHQAEKTANQQITIFDNHNHALYFWLEAMRKGVISPGATLIHIDEHSDLWENTNLLEKEGVLSDAGYAWEFTNLSCNVGNYIVPAVESGIVGKVIRVESEYQIDAFPMAQVADNSILNIDLDFFAPEMDFISEEKKLTLIKSLLPKVDCITIATSPFFIDQNKALQALHKIFRY